MRFRNPLAYIALVVTVVIATIFVLSNLEDKKREETGASLLTVLETVDHAFAIWLEHREADIEHIVKSETIIQFAQELIIAKSNNQDLSTLPLQKDIREYFNIFLNRYDDLGMFIVDREYTNLSSMRNTNIGVQNLLEEKAHQLLNSVLSGGFIITPPILSDVSLESKGGVTNVTMFIGYPIRNDLDTIIAALLIRVDPEAIFLSMTEQGRIGVSGETYAFDRTGRMVSRSRFTEQLQQIGLVEDYEDELLKIRIADPGGDLTRGYLPKLPYNELPLTVMAKSAVQGNSGQNVHGYRDYRGIRVLGRWLWDDRLGVGITAEIDEEEALASFYYTRRTVLALVTLILLASSFIMVYLEITRRKNEKALEKRKEDYKMVSLGLLLSGIAHELNNPVWFLTLGVTAIDKSLNDVFELIDRYEKLMVPDQIEEMEQLKSKIDFQDLKKELQSVLVEMQMGGKRSLDILDGLKRFSRIDDEKMIEASVHECINAAITLLKYKMKNKIELVLNYDDNVQGIWCFPGQLNQVFINILANAEQAIKDKGTIVITTADLDSEIQIAIKDDGPGMDSATQKKLFEPFYTTKNVGEGTGLGLSISHNIIEKHKGAIYCNSELGTGTEFFITLPKHLQESEQKD